MTARDEMKRSDLNKGRKRTPPKAFRPKPDDAPKHPVTDHALLRYMERVLGLDVESARQNMLTAAQIKMAQSMREGSLPVGGGHYARIVGGRVVTIV